MALAMAAGGDGDGDGITLDDMAGVTRGDSPLPSPRPSGKFSHVRRIFEWLDAHTSPVTFTALMASGEFTLGAPTIVWLADHLDAALTGSAAAPFTPPGAWNVVKVATVAAGIGWFLFGANGSPRAIKEAGRWATRLATTVLGPEHAGRAAQLAKRLSRRIIRDETLARGFVGSKAPSLRAQFGDQPWFSRYSQADLAIWWREIAFNFGLGGAWAWALDLPLLPMLLPNLYFSLIGTVTTARVTQMLAPGADVADALRKELEFRIRLWRTFVFSLLNIFSTLAATGQIGPYTAYALQAAVGAAIAVYAHTTVTSPFTNNARSDAA